MLYGSHLWEADLSEADLSGANLIKADLREAILDGAILTMADLGFAKLRGAYLRGANLRGACLIEAILDGANLSKADLRGADLNRAILVKTNFEKADLTGCKIYGISAWNLELKETIQSDLIITTDNETSFSVDNLEVAQFLYLLLNNEKLRDVIDTITSKVVLILGRFTPEREVVLNALKEELRKRNYLPILFKFEKPSSRNKTETITLLARMARFVIADITDPRSIPQELYAIVPQLPSVPVQPLLENSQKEYGMFESVRQYPWVLEPYYYNNLEEVLTSFKEKVIDPAEAKAKENDKKNNTVIS